MGQNSYPWNNPPNGLREFAQPSIAYNTDTATGAHVIPAAKLTGGAVEVDLAMTGTLAAGATATTDTAANIIAAIPVPQVYVGFTYRICILNESSGAFTWTIAGGTGVTISGTATVAQNACREFMAKITALGSTPTLTLQNIGGGTT